MKRSKRALSKKIGAYERKVRITFNSIPAFILAVGKAANPQASTTWERQELIGLRGFKNMTYTLWNQSKQDNPFADIYLIQTEDKIKKSLNFLDEKNNHLQQRLAQKFSDLGIQADLSISSSPRELIFDFGMNPYATAMLEVVAKFDRLHVIVDTCSVHRCVDKTEDQLILQQATKMIRLLFDFVRDHTQKLKNDEAYRITRTEYFERKLKTVPQDVVDKLRMPNYIQHGDVDMSEGDLAVLAGLYGLDQELDEF